MHLKPLFDRFAGTGRQTARSGLTRAAPAAAAYLADANSEEVVRGSFANLGLTDAYVVRGNIETAIEELPRRGSPHLLLVDISGINDPLAPVNRLTEVCAPDTKVIAVGDRNDIVLYRDIKGVGVAEYFYKPLVGNVLGRTLKEMSGGTTREQPSRGGRLIFVLGVRGGVGATTIATNLAWYFAEARQRRVLLLDLDLYAGDAAAQLGAQASDALREALADPKRVDELFLARGIAPIGNSLGLLATLLPLADPLALTDEAIQQLLHALSVQFRYVLVDLPGELARNHPGLLQIPSTVLLVSDGSGGSIREVGRWREFLGRNTPERAVIHVLNKKGEAGTLPDKEVLEAIPPPDLAIEWDHEIKSAAARGTKAVQACSAIQHGMSALSMRIAGVAADEDRPFWKRIFG